MSFAAIVILFFGTFLIRGLIKMPDLQAFPLNDWNIQAQARQLELTEYDTDLKDSETQQEVELSGSAIRLMLTGSRGVVTCILWVSANQKQVRNEWSELELLVNQITKIQPHFVTPWLFQSWNLAYNVSVEMDRLNDLYFYIGRGIKLLARGEAINRYNPDMRYAIATYYQSKFTVHDKVTTLRCLLEMSCMNAEDRNPEKLLTEGQVDMAKFRSFCEKYPQFVRRMRETPILYGRKDQYGVQIPMYLVHNPKEVVDFLRENSEILTRYRKRSPMELEDRLEQFPVVPPVFVNGEKELKPNIEWNDAETSGVLAARAWFAYGNEAVPPPNEEPGPTNFLYRDPEHKRRVPKQPMLIIYRQGPPRAQTYHAEQLTKEGWFDNDLWVVDEDGITGQNRWFRDTVEIKPNASAKEAWFDSYARWSRHGRDNGLLIDVDRLERMRQTALLYARRYNFPVGEGDIPQPKVNEMEDQELMASYQANIALRFYNQNRQVTNFESFLNQSEAEMDALTVQARKQMHRADCFRRNGFLVSAIELSDRILGTQNEISLYHLIGSHEEEKQKILVLSGGLGGYALGMLDKDRLQWPRILMRHERFRAVEKIQEDTYEMQLKHIRSLREHDPAPLKLATMTLFDIASMMAPTDKITPYSLIGTMNFLGRKRIENVVVDIPGFGTRSFTSEEEAFLPSLRQKVQAIWPAGPFDGINPENNLPWVSEIVKLRVRSNLGLVSSVATPAGPPPAPKTPGPPSPK